MIKTYDMLGEVSGLAIDMTGMMMKYYKKNETDYSEAMKFLPT
jgi:hypothetical protein